DDRHHRLLPALVDADFRIAIRAVERKDALCLLVDCHAYRRTGAALQVRVRRGESFMLRDRPGPAVALVADVEPGACGLEEIVLVQRRRIGAAVRAAALPDEGQVDEKVGIE